MQIFVITTMIILIALALLHFYWAFGGLIGLDKALPSKDGKRLLNPGKYLIIMVGLLLIVFAVIAYLLYYSPLSLEYLSYAGWFLSCIFILRAIGEFNAVGFFKKIKNTTFSYYDTRYFSPLSLFLGISFALLSYPL